MSNIIKRGKYVYKMKPKSGLQDKLNLIVEEIKIDNPRILLPFKAWQLIHELLLILDNKQSDVVKYLEKLILKDLKNEIDPD